MTNNRHYAGYNIATSGGKFDFDRLASADVVQIRCTYSLDEFYKTYGISNGFIRDREVVRSIHLEHIQSGTWECFNSFEEPESLLTIIQNVVEGYLNDATKDPLSIPTFNFETYLRRHDDLLVTEAARATFTDMCHP